MFSKKKFIAAPIVAGLLISVASVTGAFAQTITYNSGGVNRVQVSYNGNSHTLSVFDAAEDGYGGRTNWSATIPSQSGTLDNSNGVGSTTTKGFAAGGQIVFNACAKNNSVTVGCTGDTSDAK